MKSTWSEVDSERLLSLFEQGVKYTAIAEILGKTPGAVESKIHRLGWTRSKKWTLPELNYLRELVGDRPHKSLLRKYNNWARANGYPERAASNLWAKANRLGMSRRLDSADWYTVTQISEVMGCATSTVRMWLKCHEQILRPTIATKSDRGHYAVKRKNLKAFLIKFPGIVEQYRSSVDLIWLIDLLGEKQ